MALCFSTSFFSFFFFLLSFTFAEELFIPQVEAAVRAQQHQFNQYTSYAGPTGTALSEALRPSARPRPLNLNTQAKTAAAAAAAPYWYEAIAHQGRAAFNTNSTYQVYRNVKSYGAKGDGVTDDTAAIQKAVSDGNRCAPSKCSSTSDKPAVVYFPAGTYLISSSILDYYNTQLVGNPNNLPVLKAKSTFSGLGVIDGDQYEPGNPAGVLGFGSTNVFWRQVRNFIIDLTAIPATSGATGIHWPTAQATSLQNIVFKMSDAPGTQHQGIFIESGSGGFMNDLVFYGGVKGVVFGNQQFTVRNLTFYNAVTAISQIWDWGWTYKSISVNNCTTALDMSNGGPSSQAVGSVTLLDSSFTNTKVGFNLARTSSSSPATGGSLAIENLALSNVPVAVQGPNNAVYLAGTTGKTTVAGWQTGNAYTPNGPKTTQGSVVPPTRPTSLVVNGKYYERSKPQYNNLPVSSFSSVRAGGAKGDGMTDDTTALQNVINSAVSAGKVVFVDAGTYKVTKTIFIPKGSKIVGESYSVIMSAGSFFADIKNPKAVVQVGNPGDTGVVEWSDMMVSTQGAQAGAVLIKWNLASTPSAPSGMWDVHTRIGGFKGSNLTLANCPTTPTSAAVNTNCIAAYMSMHITKTASSLYMENVWLWVADHDVDDSSLKQITIYAGRGLYIESTAGTFWLVGTAVEHHTLYQYQLASTNNIFMGQIQTETPYYQPNPQGAKPFSTVNTTINDPNFGTYCPSGSSPTCSNAFGLRLVGSSNIFVYGAGLYSFFNNYSTNCSNADASSKCQPNIFTYDSAYTKGLYVQNLNTVGTTNMVTRDATSLAKFSDDKNMYPSTIVFFKSG